MTTFILCNGSVQESTRYSDSYYCVYIINREMGYFTQRLARSLLVILLITGIGEARRIGEGMPPDMFRELVGGDISGFIRRAGLSRDT